MHRILFTTAIAISCLEVSAQSDLQPVLRNNLPQGAEQPARVFDNQSAKPQPVPLKNSESLPPADNSSTLDPALPPALNENSKDSSGSSIYVPLPMEDKAFAPVDPYLYHEGTDSSGGAPKQYIEPLPFNPLPDMGYSTFGADCGEPCCPPSFCRCLCDDCGRNITFFVGGLYLRRSDPDSRIIFENPRNPQQRFSASAFDFGLEGGIETGLTFHRLLNELDFDLRYFSVSDWIDRKRVRFFGNNVQINTNPAFNMRGSRSIVARYESDLSNVEANVRYRYGGGWNWMTFIAGFRYLNLDESMSGRFTNPAGTYADESFRTAVSNDLYGIQIGMDKALAGDCLYSIEYFWRAGLYGNNSQSRTQQVSHLARPLTRIAQGDASEAAFVGEAGIKARYSITSSINFYGTYQVLFVDGVALAGEQLAVTNLTAGTGINPNSDVFYHGASFGLELVY